MFKDLIRTYKETLIYSLGNLGNKIVGFILIPLYTTYIPISEYGILGLIEPITQLLFATLGLGLNSAFMRWYSISKDETEKKTIFFNTNLIIILNTLFFVILFILFSHTISAFVLNSVEYTLILQIAFVNVFFLVVNPIIFSTLRIEHKALNFSLVRSGQFVITLVLNIYLIAFLNYGIIAIFISQAASSMLVFFYFIPFYIRHSSIQFRRPLFVKMIKFGLPLIPVGISNILINMINRYILEYYDTLSSVGLFSFAFRLSNTIKVVIIESITLSLTPILYKKLSDKHGKRFVQKNYIYTFFLVMLFYLFSSSFIREFIFIFARNKDYYNAYLLFPIIAAVALINSINYFYTILFNYARKTVTISIVTITTALISIGLNFLLIPVFKIYGAAAALVISALFLLLLLQYNSKKNFGAYFENRKILLMMSVGVTIVIINFVFFMELSIGNFFIKLVLCFSFPLILYKLNFYESIELIRIKDIVKTFLRMGK